MNDEAFDVDIDRIRPPDPMMTEISYETVSIEPDGPAGIPIDQTS